MPGSENPLLDFRLTHRIERLPKLLDAIEALAATNQWDPHFRSQVLLAVEELVVNAVMHGDRNPDEGWISVRLLGALDGLTIRIVDNGKAFDPFSSAPNPSLDLDLESRSIGGLGVHFVKEVTDRQTYSRIGSENHVILFKYWPD